MCKETHAASPSMQPSSTLMLFECTWPHNIVRHAQVSPLTHVTCCLARYFVNITAVATAY